MGLDRLWPVDLDCGDWWIFGFWVWAQRGFGSIMANGFGSELGFGFWIWDRCGLTEIGDHGDFFFLGLMVAPMVGFWFGLN